ncbi:MAG: DUF1330 domain-containing protein [Anaerolineaceae bacterium]|nr:DUF1330 domain-containing protein [Anaerolineaceae bacterium]
MTAYVIVDIEVTDPINYETVKTLTPPIVAKYGGEYLSRGGFTEVIEGDWHPKRLVIITFENSDKAKAWLNSPEFAPIREMRAKTAFTRMVITESDPQLIPG